MGDGLDRAAATTNVIPAETPSAPYLAIDAPDWTGGGYADHGAKCDPANPAHAQLWAHQVDDTCFLTPETRQRIVGQYQLRVETAHTSYLNALTEVRIDTLLEKAHESSSFLFDVVLDVIGMITTRALTTAITALRDENALSDFTKDVVRAKSAVSRAEGSTLKVVAQVISAGRRAMPKPQPPDVSAKKASSLSFLGALRQEAASMYRVLQEDAPAFAYDGELLVMTRSFQDELHSIDVYKAAISDALSSFQNSPVSAIGIRATNDLEEMKNQPEEGYIDRVESEYAPNLYSRRFQETKVAWVQGPTERRLAIYQRPRWRPGLHTIVDEPVSPEWEAEDLAQRPFEFIEFVPERFIDVAVQMHVEKWGTPPEVRPPLEDEVVHWRDP